MTYILEAEYYASRISGVKIAYVRLAINFKLILLCTRKKNARRILSKKKKFDIRGILLTVARCQKCKVYKQDIVFYDVM